MKLYDPDARVRFVALIIPVLLVLFVTSCDDTDSHDSTVVTITVCEVCWPPGHCMREDHPQFDEAWNALTAEEQASATWERCEDYHERPPRRLPWLTNSEQME